jgi:hypothetical protein
MIQSRRYVVLMQSQGQLTCRVVGRGGFAPHGAPGGLHLGFLYGEPKR